jgi:hypothetical protein
VPSPQLEIGIRIPSIYKIIEVRFLEIALIILEILMGKIIFNLDNEEQNLTIKSVINIVESEGFDSSKLIVNRDGDSKYFTIGIRYTNDNNFSNVYIIGHIDSRGVFYETTHTVAITYPYKIARLIKKFTNE